MTEQEIAHLRVLIADERQDRLALLADLVVGLGHEVVARETEIRKAGAATARERPDVALVVEFHARANSRSRLAPRASSAFSGQERTFLAELLPEWVNRTRSQVISHDGGMSRVLLSNLATSVS
jgi:hypothetical protein